MDCCSKSNVYIDDTTTISLDEKLTRLRAQATVQLAIHIVGRPVFPNEPIPRQDLVSINKSIAEGRMEEIKIDLGWRFDTRRVLVALPDNKYTAWSQKLLR